MRFAPSAEARLTRLEQQWYIKTDGFKVIETRPNPISALKNLNNCSVGGAASTLLTPHFTVLDVGQAISLFFGVVANAALVARFLEKRPLATTWIAIVSLGIHGNLLRL